MFFFLFQSLTQDTTTTFSCHISLDSSWLWQFFRLFLFLITLIVLNIGQVFCRMSLSWDLSDVSLMVRLRVWVLGGETQRWSAIFNMYQGNIISRAHTVNMICPCWCYTRSPGWSSICQDSMLWNYTFLPPSFHISLFRRKSLRAAHT